jgi:hypothetical protein
MKDKFEDKVKAIVVDVSHNSTTRPAP